MIYYFSLKQLIEKKFKFTTVAAFKNKLSHFLMSVLYDIFESSVLVGIRVIYYHFQVYCQLGWHEDEERSLNHLSIHVLLFRCAQKQEE